MAVFKSDFPILEYDTTKEAIFMPDHEKLGIQFPKKAVLAFLSDRVDKYAHEHSCKAVAEFDTITKKYPAYITTINGEDIVLCQAPLGGSAAVQVMDWLIGYGVEKIIATGCCGALIDMPENVFLIPTKALRDEGASYKYLPPARFVEIPKISREPIERYLSKNGFNYDECVTWSTDGFFRETVEMVNYRKAEGCTVVDMECASLAACAEFRSVEFAQLLFTADTLADTDSYDTRGWGLDSFETALELSLNIAAEM